MLGRSEDAQAEARKAYATELAKPWQQDLPDSDDAQRAATEAAAQAQTRTAEHLLAVRREQLHTPGPPRSVDPAPARARRPPGRRRGLGGDHLNTVPELSGVDLARQALLTARETAKKNGAQTQKPKRRTTVVVRDSRVPLAFGTAIGMMMTERDLVAPAAGGSILAQWDTTLTAAATKFAGHVRAVAVD
ncbi:hypothetical protein GCM10010497_59490 [Streptomyces cinereoruber]|nr:hypothetical protein GCM10010497_59490 [Streptomyces cinereoruber]